MKETHITFRLKQELKDKVLTKSACTGIPVTFVLTKALEKWVKGEKNEHRL